MSFICSVCGFKQPFNDATLFSHLRTHLKQNEMVDCPFKNCQYRTNVYSSFNAHKSRNHLDWDVSDFKNEIVLIKTDNHSVQSQVEYDEAGPSETSPELDAPGYDSPDLSYDSSELQVQLKNNLASLFLKKCTVFFMCHRWLYKT